MTLEEMKAVDIRNVDHETLVDASDFNVNMNLSKEKRITAAIDYFGNPYCFKCGKIAVKLSYSQTETTIDDCLESYIKMSSL